MTDAAAQGMTVEGPIRLEDCPLQSQESGGQEFPEKNPCLR